MKYVALSCVAVFAAILGASARGEQPGPHYRHLQVIEPHIGHWKYEGVDEEGRKITGEETGEWILNKNFMRTVGTWSPEGAEPTHYELITGWDPIQKRIVMGAPLSDGGHLTRIGTFDSENGTWRSRQNSVDGDGHKYSSVCTIKFLDENTWTATWTEATRDGKPQPDSRITATRVLETPGLPREVVERLDRMVGVWKLEGQASRGPLKGTWSVRWAPGRHCLVIDYPLTVGGRNARGSGLWAWDASTKEMVWHASYQRGGIETARTKRVARGVYRGPYSVVVDGKTYQGTVEQTFPSPDEWTVKTTGLASQGTDDLSVRAVRVGAKPVSPDVSEEEAEGATSMRQKYFDFWKPHAGVWKITISEEGREDATGVFSYQPSPTGLCYLGRGTTEDGKPILDGLYGYRADKKCWFDVEFMHWQGSYYLYTGLLEGDVETPLRTGSTVSIRCIEIKDGETVRFRTTRRYKALEKDRIVFVHQDRITTEGKSLPDVTLSFERMK